MDGRVGKGKGRKEGSAWVCVRPGSAVFLVVERVGLGMWCWDRTGIGMSVGVRVYGCFGQD